ncbi:hypothetical protein ACW7B9_25070, partial [Klebsiella pneumoniae]
QSHRALSEHKTLSVNWSHYRADAALAELTQPAPQEGLALEGVVEQSAFLGNLYRHSVRCHDRLLLADAAQCWPTKSRVRLHVPTPALHIFPLPLSQ